MAERKPLRKTKTDERISKDRAERVIREVSGYSNRSNPFGDARLSERFEWTTGKGRRLETDSIEDLHQEMVAARERRQERERERERRERERLAEMADKDGAGDWETQEQRFLGEQARKRADLRLTSGRAQPEDRLHAVLRAIDHDPRNEDRKVPLAVLHAIARDKLVPHQVIELADAQQVATLRAEIDVQMNLGANTDYWHAVASLLHEREHDARTQGAGGAAVHREVASSVTEMLADKDMSELSTMAREVDAMLSVPGDGAVDQDYWTEVARQIRVMQARSVLQTAWNRSRDVARAALAEAGVSPEEPLPAELATGAGASAGGGAGDEAAARIQRTVAMTHEEDQEDIGEGDEWEAFGDEVAMDEDGKLIDWDGEERFRPRKPKVYNRILTGYDWNKYNQMHYDKDNPPPKTVRGYRFNVFYPDLIDASKPPTFTLTKAPGETALLTFKAGPPYLDIAFRIVDRPWQRGKRSGYRCQWERGVLSLWFNFSRLRYRR